MDVRKPATMLVTTGPYRYTRNPMYLALALLYLGITLTFNALGALVLLPVALGLMQWGVIVREERYLARKFGDAYLRYKATVRRWL